MDSNENNNLNNREEIEEPAKNKLSEEEKEKKKKLDEAFVRWQNQQINWHMFTINLFITFSFGIIYFIAEHHKYYNVLILFLLAISLMFGFAALFTRLFNFRKTKDICEFKKLSFDKKHNISYKKADRYSETEIEIKISNLRDKTDDLGRATWCLFYLQSIFFAVAGLWSIITIIISNSGLNSSI